MAYKVAHNWKGVKRNVSHTKEERFNVRVPVELAESVREAAERSGWGVSDQIRFELMQLRGMWNPYLPSQPASSGKEA